MHGELFPGEGEKVPGDLIFCLAEKWPVARKEGNRKNYKETAVDAEAKEIEALDRKAHLKNQRWGTSST